MQETNRLIHSIELTNFLSFGESSGPMEMQPLNVLIGPNASGKSNLIEAIGLLSAAPTDLTAPIREGGGIGEWVWKGRAASPEARIEAILASPHGDIPLRYRLAFAASGQRFELTDEVLENERPDSSAFSEPRFFYRFQNGHPVLNVRGANEEDEQDPSQYPNLRRLKREGLEPNQSVMLQRKDPDQYPEITYLGKRFAAIMLYREWTFGRYTAPRRPQRPDFPGDFLLPDASNLGLVLNDLEHRLGIPRLIKENLGKFSSSFQDVTVKLHGGSVQLYLHEKGLGPVPATRLSDGTLRYLCLLAILCHPSPPPVICIEEPELGMHPDIMPTIAELLIDASKRTQLFVTTHSVELVDALSEKPEAIVVCEKQDGATRLRRLQPPDLSEWLKKYALGELWQRGEIGGNRW